MHAPRGDVRSRPVTSLNLIDPPWLFAMCELLSALAGRKINVQYGALRHCLDQVRAQLKWPATMKNLAAAGVDQRSRAQQGFVEAVRAQEVTIDPIDYRWLRVSTPLETDAPMPQSVMPQFAYALGLLAARGNSDVVICSGSFDLYVPLLDFVENRGGKACVAFFRQYLDPRWAEFGGIGDDTAPIKFVDLTPHAQAILGIGIERPSGPSSASGLASL